MHPEVNIMFRFYFIRSTMLIIYTATAIYSMWFWLMPVIRHHGGWNALFTFIVCTLVCFITSFLFFSTRKPMATHKPFNNHRSLT